MAARHSRRATRALQRLAETDPAFASLSLWIAHEDSETRPLPAWSDASTIFYGPGFETLSLAEQTGVAAHHILHVAFRHAARGAAMRVRFGPGHDESLFNLACDVILNEALVCTGYVLPRPAALLSDLLRDTLGDIGEPRDALARWDAEGLYVRLRADAGDSGRRPAAEAARDWVAAQGFASDLDTGGDPDDGEENAADWRQRIAKAMEAGRRSGRGIGMVGHRLADLPEVRTPWEVILRGLVTRAVTELPRQSWHRPTGRWLALDASGRAVPFEPATRRTARVPLIVVALDSSGSIEDARLQLFGAQVAGIARRTGAEVHVLVFDDGVRDRRVLRGRGWDAAVRDLAFARGGGTDFAEVLAEADRLDPAVIVVLTDLDAPVPRPPRAPVIWAVPDTPPEAPPFGRVLSLAR